MIRSVRFASLGICLLLFWSVAQAAQVPIIVNPDPVQFGTVPLNSTSFPFTIFVTNTSANSLDVTGMTISGTNAPDFAFFGATCVGFIGVGQTCQMSLTFTPSATGSLSGNLLIAFQGTGSPLTVPLDGTGGNPIPTITTLSPSSVYVGSPAFTLTVNGTGFMPGSVVYWENFTPLTTTYKSSTQVTAQVPASDLTSTNSAFVSVTNPPPGGGSSFSATFNIIALDPSVSSLSPNSLVSGNAATSLVVNGNNFMTGATVLWNGTPRSTTYVNSSQLQAQLSAGDLAKPEIVQVSVSNPSPGGVSSILNFNVTFPAVVRILNLPANDLVWDPYAQRIYATLPSSFGSNGNSIAVVNPKNGSVLGYHFAGSEPNQVALSDDGKYIYAGLNGNGSVQRIIIPGYTLDTDVSLGTNSFGGMNIAGDLKVSPGDSHTFAVALSSNSCCGGGPLEFFKDATLLPNSISFPQISVIQFVDPTTLYGYSNNTLSQVAVNASGGTVTTQWNSGLTGSGNIQYDAGLIYGDSGQVFNPQTGLLVGSYDVSGGCCNSSNHLLPDSTVDRTFAGGITPFFSLLGVTGYNLSQFTPIAVINLSQLSGNLGPSFIRWGSNGLAFVVQNGCCGNTTNQLVIVQSSMILPVSTTKNPAPVATSLSPASAVHGGGNFKLTIHGSGFVAGSQATWNTSGRTVAYVSPTQLTVYVPWSDIASAGTASVVVTNPAPGGGKSTTLTFTIN